MIKNPKVGDWIFHEFKLKVVEDINSSGEINSVSDGYFITGGAIGNHLCFPLNKRVKDISERFDRLYNRIYSEGERLLSFPSIHNLFVNMWVEMCNEKDDDEKYIKNIEVIEKIAQEIIDNIKDVRNIRIKNVQIFK